MAMPVTDDCNPAIAGAARRLRVASVSGSLQGYAQLAFDHGLDKTAHPITNHGFNRVKPIVEKIYSRISDRLRGIMLRGNALHGVQKPPPSCSTGKSWLHFWPPPVDFCSSRLAIGAATERARALAMPAGTRAQVYKRDSSGGGPASPQVAYRALLERAGSREPADRGGVDGIGPRHIGLQASLFAPGPARAASEPRSAAFASDARARASLQPCRLAGFPVHPRPAPIIRAVVSCGAACPSAARCASLLAINDRGAAPVRPSH